MIADLMGNKRRKKVNNSRRGGRKEEGELSGIGGVNEDEKDVKMSMDAGKGMIKMELIKKVNDKQWDGDGQDSPIARQ